MKYRLLTNDTKVNFLGVTLFRIQKIECGTLGGYIESEKNLSQSGNAWVYGNAMVFGNAKVYGNAMVYDDAMVCGNAKIYDDADVYGNAMVYDGARVHGNAWVYGNAKVYGNARVCGDDKVTSIVGNITNLLEFNFTFSLKDKYIRVGCKSHGFDFWFDYLNNNKTDYVKHCKSEDSHRRLCEMIRFILDQRG